MSNIETVTNNGKEHFVIKDVVFGNIHVNGYRLKEGDNGNYKVFAIEFFTDKSTYKDIKKKYKKVVTEEIDNDDIERRFHIPVPFPDSDEQFKVTMYVGAERKNKNGEMMEMWKDDYMNLNLRPKAYDSEGNNITKNYFINGAKGSITFNESVNMKGTKNQYLHPYFNRLDLTEFEFYVKPE